VVRSPGIGIALFLVFELMLKFFAPQLTMHEGEARLGEPDPVMGATLFTDNHVIELHPEFRAEYHVNSQGFRSRRHYGKTPDEGVTRILVVGDSFSFALGVNDNETWSARLEDKLLRAGRRVEIINSGIPGLDTRSASLHVKRLIDEYAPTTVMLGFVPNDLFSNQPLDYKPPKPKGPPPKRTGTGGRLHSVTFVKRQLLQFDALYVRLYGMTSRAAYFQTPPSERVKKTVAITKGLLQGTQQLCHDRGVRLVVVSLPQQFQLLYQDSGHGIGGLDVQWIDREFGEHASDAGYTWLPTLTELSERRREHGKPLFYRQHGHLDTYGNETLADVLAARMLAERHRWERNTLALLEPLNSH